MYKYFAKSAVSIAKVSTDQKPGLLIFSLCRKQLGLFGAASINTKVH